MNDPVVDLLEVLVQIARGGFKPHVIEEARSKPSINIDVTSKLSVTIEFSTGLLYHTNGDKKLVAYCGPNIAGLRHSLFQEITRLLQLQMVQSEPWIAVIHELRSGV